MLFAFLKSNNNEFYSFEVEHNPEKASLSTDNFHTRILIKFNTRESAERNRKKLEGYLKSQKRIVILWGDKDSLDLCMKFQFNKLLINTYGNDINNKSKFSKENLSNFISSLIKNNALNYVNNTTAYYLRKKGIDGRIKSYNDYYSPYPADYDVNFKIELWKQSEPYLAYKGNGCIIFDTDFNSIRDYKILLNSLSNNRISFDGVKINVSPVYLTSKYINSDYFSSPSSPSSTVISSESSSSSPLSSSSPVSINSSSSSPSSFISSSFKEFILQKLIDSSSVTSFSSLSPTTIYSSNSPASCNYANNNEYTLSFNSKIFTPKSKLDKKNLDSVDFNEMSEFKKEIESVLEFNNRITQFVHSLIPFNE
jgi:hypothetical protein